MIQAYSIHGKATEALKLFEAMQELKIQPSQITLVSILNVCSHTGLVDHAWDIISTMKQKFGIEPLPQHQACMVDAWGR